MWRSLWRRRWARRAIATAVGLGVLGIVLLVVAYVSVSLPADPVAAQTTVVLDADGNVLAELFDVENRALVSLDQVAPVMRDAVIAAEDRNFYRHRGLDPFGIARAFLNDVRGKRLQGGSTITQQLVKNTYLSPERSLLRKAKEAILSVKVERSYSKDEILERYLNAVYFGRGAYGIEKAARLWFGVSARELSLPQAALLAGLIRAPETADPATKPDVASTRRRIVLDAMVRNGFVTATDAATAAATPIAVIPRANPDAQLAGTSAYFVAQVRQWLIARYGEQVAFGGGLRVQTTLRPAMQQAAERAVFDILDRPDDPDAALVAIDERGAVVAMIGGKDFATSKVNLALGPGGGGRGRQAGSTFKPFVLAAAFEAGIPITQRYVAPAQIDVEVDGIAFDDVDNYGNESYGSMDLIEATARSVNTVYAQLIADVGIAPVVDTATKLGITTPIEPNPSIALGAEEVAPIDMAASFMTFANRGEHVRPFLVDRVIDAGGNVIYTADDRRARVFPEQYADLMNHVLEAVIERGTGRAADIGRPAAGKTGTTSDYADAWFVGYTPKLGAAVWMGYKEGTDRKMTSVRGRAVTGGSFPARIWQAFMTAALDGIDTGDFDDPPEDVLHPEGRDDDGDDAEDADEETTSTSSSTTTTTTESDGSTTSTSSASTTAEDGDDTTTTSTTEGGSGSSTTTTTTSAPTTSTSRGP